MKVILSCSLFLLVSWVVNATSDPTKPDAAVGAASAVSAANAAALAAVPFKLSLLKDVKGQYLAVINGQVVKTGDQIDGFTVMHITRQQVVLQKATERLTLNLFKAMKTQ